MLATPSDLAQALVARHRAAREGIEKRAISLRHAVDSEVRDVITAGTVRGAWLIGSLAGGSFGERSDVDLVFEGLSVDRVGLLAAHLAERLKVRVDVLRIEELSDSFRSRVLAEGQAIVP